MSFEDKGPALSGSNTCTFHADAIAASEEFRKQYETRTNVVKAEDMPWERSPDGLIKPRKKAMASAASLRFVLLKNSFHYFEIAMADDEIDFLLKMGTNQRDYRTCSLSKLSSAEFKKFFETMFSKGFIKATKTKGDVENFILHPIMVGWFEMCFAGGKETEDGKNSQKSRYIFQVIQEIQLFPLTQFVKSK